MGRETGEGLGIRQHGSGRPPLDVAFIYADQCVQHGRIFKRIRICGKLVFFCGTVQEAREDFRTEGE
jgi:hypothetical protein